eukprot:GHVL01030621.1.p2 GENE.GHVL01030621.1~~GHVL01030621.1.p2  ORF type:complete len:122 (+),score=6.92 GHVL01030621.1:424-789(+)
MSLPIFIAYLFSKQKHIAFFPMILYSFCAEVFFVAFEKNIDQINGNQKSENISCNLLPSCWVFCLPHTATDVPLRNGLQTYRSVMIFNLVFCDRRHRFHSMWGIYAKRLPPSLLPCPNVAF